MYDVCSYEHALNLLFKGAPFPSTCSKSIPIQAAIGRINAEDIFSPCAFPRFNTAAMDGYALRSMDVADADEDNPVHLSIQGIVAAGDSMGALGKQRTCVEIMTGAALPRGADAILRVESAEVSDGDLILRQSIHHGQHVRWSGEDLKQNEPVLRKGRLLGLKELHVLIMLGLQSVMVFDIHIGIVSTGAELVSRQTQNLTAAADNTEVINCNGPFLKAALSRHGTCTEYEIVPDNFNELKDVFITAASTCDIVVCTGGVSAGKFDFTRRVLDELGETIFHGVQIKPGRPVLYGKLLCSTERPVHFFGLPGTPMAVAATYRFLVRPFMEHRCGAIAETPFYLPVLHDVADSSNVTLLQRGIRRDGTVMILPHRASINETMDANCWVMRSPGSSPLRKSKQQFFATFSE